MQQLEIKSKIKSESESFQKVQKVKSTAEDKMMTAAIQKHLESMRNAVFSIQIGVMQQPFGFTKVSPTTEKTVMKFIKRVCQQWKVPYTEDMKLVLQPNGIVQDLSCLKAGDVCRIMDNNLYEPLRKQSLKAYQEAKRFAEDDELQLQKHSGLKEADFMMFSDVPLKKDGPIFEIKLDEEKRTRIYKYSNIPVVKTTKLEDIFDEKMIKSSKSTQEERSQVGQDDLIETRTECQTVNNQEIIEVVSNSSDVNPIVEGNTESFISKLRKRAPQKIEQVKGHRKVKKPKKSVFKDLVDLPRSFREKSKSRMNPISTQGVEPLTLEVTQKKRKRKRTSTTSKPKAKSKQKSKPKTKVKAKKKAKAKTKSSRRGSTSSRRNSKLISTLGLSCGPSPAPAKFAKYN